MHTTVHIPSFSIHALQVRVFVHNHTITNKLFSYHSHHYATKTVSFINHCHSARRPWTSKGPPTLGPYKNIPDIYLRRGRRKDETPTLRLVRRMSYAHRTLGRKNISGKLWYGPKSRVSSQHLVRMRRIMDDPYRVGCLRMNGTPRYEVHNPSFT